MLLSKLIGERTKQAPSDATIKSHSMLIRAGYIKQLANGIYSLTMPAHKIIKNIENIIREEMNAIDGQEVSLPITQPRELWDESGRYNSIGEELLRFKDRQGRDMCLAMTHEEAAVHLVRDGVNSYTQLPFMIYQFQTKFRDETRSRGGLIRVREFIMKDAYSFHASVEDLEDYYKKAHQAYENIFRRIGMKNFISVQSDSGMMGGKIAHEFMLLTDIGEDTLAICKDCNYKANMEVALSILAETKNETAEEAKEVFTGEAKEITQVAEYLNVDTKKIIKAVVYAVKGGKDLVVAFTRGDLEVNEAKLRKAIGKEIVPCNLDDSEALVAGNIGILNLDSTKAKLIYDESIKNTVNMVTGANKKDYHIKGVNTKEILKDVQFVDIRKVKDNDICPLCKGSLSIKNGIEVGNIFQLGTKYTQTMSMSVLGNDGRPFHPIMGCYGIGLGRSLASIAEEYSDEKGLIWPMAIAPFKVYLCPLRYEKEEVKEPTDKIYQDLKEQGIDVILDDRKASPGYKFSDCDLMGIPIRVVVSPRSLEKNSVEINLRDGSFAGDVLMDNLTAKIKELIATYN